MKGDAPCGPGGPHGGENSTEGPAKLLHADLTYRIRARPAKRADALDPIVRSVSAAAGISAVPDR